MARVCLTTEYTEHTERHSSAVSREDAKIGGRVVPTSRLPLCGRMVSGFIAERREGQASACPRTSRRSSLPPSGGNAAEPWKISASSSLCVKKTLNSQRSTLNSQRSAGVDARAPDCARTEHALDSHGSCRQPITHGAFYAPRLLVVAGGGDVVPTATNARVPSG